MVRLRACAARLFDGVPDLDAEGLEQFAQFLLLHDLVFHQRLREGFHRVSVCRDEIACPPVSLPHQVLDGPVNLAIRAYRWQYLLDPLGKVRFGSAFRATAVGFAALALLCPADERVLLPGLATRPTEDELSGRGLAVRIDIDSLRAYLESCETLDDAADITSPVLLVHARGDAVVPLDHSLTLAAALGGATDLVILAGGDHGSAQASPAVHERVIRWLIARTERT